MIQDVELIKNRYARNVGEPKDFPDPPRRRGASQLGGRRISTTALLRGQGLTKTKSSSGEFAVRSIRQGSDDWASLIKPFVSDLAFRSCVNRRYHSEVSFRPYTCHAAVLFVDLCSYSRITAAIAHRGAHFLSSVVNAYLSQILGIVREHGGDVVKFAGDAVLIVWEGTEDDLQFNVLQAAKCVLQMQRDAGSHPVEGTDYAFRIHCGLHCGTLESEIFRAPVHENMQRLYHSCGGDAVEEMSDLVDLAKAGEVCVSKECFKMVGARGTFKDVPDATDGPKILESMNLNSQDEADMEDYMEEAMADRHSRRNNLIEEEFIHPVVLQLLTLGGLSPTQIAQMRNLCVLFVAMTANGNSVNWLMEVQQVLDKYRCPIVQIINDDKGVHVVAAVNLYEAAPEASLLGLKVCKELVNKQVGCAIGISKGPCFCGVTGSGSVACRWDITGPPAVRAARLMQYALDHQVEVAIDQSLYDDPLAMTRTAVLCTGVKLKGTLDPCNVYTLAESTKSAAFRLLETVHPTIQNDAVQSTHDHIAPVDKSRSAVLITGPPDSCKKIVAQRAAGFADLVPFQHNCGGQHGMLQLAHTMAIWYSYVDAEQVRHMAERVLEHLNHHRLSRAHDECVALVQLAIESRIRACFVINRVQYLDEFSFSLIRECLHGHRKVTRNSSTLTHASSFASQRSSSTLSSDGDAGKITFLCIHCGLYNSPSPLDIVEQITRSHKRLEVPIIKVGESSKEDLQSMFRELWDANMTDRALKIFAEIAGYFAGYFLELTVDFLELTVAMRRLSSAKWSNGRTGYVELTEDCMIDIPRGSIEEVRRLPVMQISADVTTRVGQIYDDLPPVFQIFCKILALSNRNGYFRLPLHTMWEVINDIVAEGVDAELMQVILNEMVDMCLLKIAQENGEDALAFQSLSLGDIALDVCTPIQVDSIAEALIERLDTKMSSSFKVPLVVAELHGCRFKPNDEARNKLWRRAHQAFQNESVGMDKDEANKWKELITEKITAGGGYSVTEVLGADLVNPERAVAPADSNLKLLHFYRAPIALGPMGHSLSCICRNTFQEMTAFCGTCDSKVAGLRCATESASVRYLAEVAILEDFLEPLGLRASAEQLEKERCMIETVSKHAKCAGDVRAKAAMLLHEYIPIVCERVKRLCSMIHKVRRDDGSLPDILHDAPRMFRHAYKALFWDSKSNRTDAAQDSIMILATHNYKPKPLTEHLPLLYYQTVTRIRNRVLSRVTNAEMVFFHHQHSVDDLEAFLIVTPLLYQAQGGIDDS